MMLFRSASLIVNLSVLLIQTVPQGSRKQAGARAFWPGPEMVGLMVGNCVGLPELVKSLTRALDLGVIGSETSLHATAPLGELSKDALLSQRGADPFGGSDCEVSKDNANAAI